MKISARYMQSVQLRYMDYTQSARTICFQTNAERLGELNKDKRRLEGEKISP